MTLYPPGSFRTGNVDGADSHFAFGTDDFDVRRNGPAGFPQFFLLDPDRNIIEINGAA